MGFLESENVKTEASDIFTFSVLSSYYFWNMMFRSRKDVDKPKSILWRVTRMVRAWLSCHEVYLRELTVLRVEKIKFGRNMKVVFSYFKEVLGKKVKFVGFDSTQQK